MWTCPECKRPFANDNQEHSCVNRSVDEFLADKSPKGVRLYRAFEAAVKEQGPVTIIAVKTRIGFQVRMIFAAVNKITGADIHAHLVFARRVESPRFRRVTTFSPRNHLHEFKITSEEQIDDEMKAWIKEAYAVGEQKHLKK